MLHVKHSEVGLGNWVVKALVFPLEDRGWLQKFVIGGSIGLLLEACFVGMGFLLTWEAAFTSSLLAQAANFPALGFALSIFQTALTGPQTGSMPSWRRWPTLCVRGLLVFSLAIVYEAIPALFVISGFGFLLSGGAILALGVVLIMLGILAGMTIGFFLPMVIARALLEHRLEAVLHPVAVWTRIRKVLAEYAEAYLLCIGLFILAGLLGSIPAVGVLIWPFLTFYLLVVGARLFGRICSGAG